MSNQIDRRQFLASGVSLVGMAGVSASSVVAESQAPQPASARTRYSVFDPRSKIDSYRKGVATMKKWGLSDANDPRGWGFQAAIHGSYTRQGPLFNQCQHYSRWFFPWHRAYLYFFERIVRAASEDDSFSLPYWDWDSPSRIFLPSQFRDPNSELYESQRNSGFNDGTTGISRVDLNIDGTMSAPQFFGQPSNLGFGGIPGGEHFKGRMEKWTHDQVHAQLGGKMGDPKTAAEDPIFWTHHCNVDRLWDVWLAKGHSNPPDAWWLDNMINGQQALWTFYDFDKQAVQVKASDFLIGAPRLDYEYDSLDGNPRPLLADRDLRNRINQQRIAEMAAKAPRIQMSQNNINTENHIVVTSKDNRNILGVEPTRVQATIEVDKRPMLMTAVPLAASQEGGAPGVLLNIEDVRASGPPGVIFRVYLNELGATSATNPNEANFVGSIAIFQSSNPQHRMAGNDPQAIGDTFSFDISRLVQSLTERGKWNPDAVNVTIVSKGVGTIDNPKTEVTFSRVSISIDK